MRWLLVLLVVLLQVQAPALAQAASPQMGDCHQMAPAGGNHAPEKAQSVAHLCPGCSIPGVAPQFTPQPDLLFVEPAALVCRALASRADPPSTPPPREP